MIAYRRTDAGRSDDAAPAMVGSAIAPPAYSEWREYPEFTVCGWVTSMTQNIAYDQNRY